MTIPRIHDVLAVVHCAGPGDGRDESAQPARPAPGQPATPPDRPRGEPQPPTDKPLPDLPNPSEVGEDG